MFNTLWIKLVLVIAIAFSVVNAAEEATANTTVDVTKTKDSRGKRNLQHFGNFGASRRNDGYNYQPSGYSYEPNNYIGGGVAPASNNFGHHHYPEPLEPIIEIIIQDNNETLPPPEPIVQGKKKKEQVQVFYVKYHKDEKSGLVIHDPIPALSPIGHNQEEEEYEEPERVQIVTPLPPQRSTTLRTIIRPDSMTYESDSGVHVTFGSAHNHHSKSDNSIPDEDKVESAIRPVIQLPQNRVGPIAKRAPQTQTQGRIVNGGQPANYHHQAQQLVQSPPNQRPHFDFNPQNNFVAQNQHVSHQLSLPSQEPSKPFHPNHHHQAPPQPIQQQQPRPIPVHHQQQPQFNQQQNVLAHQQFNQPPQRLPQPQPQLQQQQVFRPPPPQRPPVNQNFNQNQKPFNYHAHQNQAPSQVRFPSQSAPPQQNFQQNFPPHFPPPQNLQRPQGHQIPPRQGPPPSFQVNRPVQQFSQPQFPPNQGPPPSFRPNQEQQNQQLVQPLHQHNQQAIHQNQHQVQSNQNVFPGGLTVQPAPNLAGPHQPRPQFAQQPQQSFQEDAGFRQQQHSFIKQNFGSDVQVQSSVPKFEHHITETLNNPIFFQPTAIDMDRFQHEKNSANIGPLSDNIGHLNVQHQPRPESQHRFAVNQQHNQHHQHGSVSNHYSEVLPQIENQQKQFASQGSFLELNGRNNFSPEQRAQPTTATPTTTVKVTTTTQKPAPSTTKKPVNYELPDEVPDDLRQQLLSSGILENAQISILDYDKIGETSLQDLPPEHLANFFNAGGGAQIGASNKVISVLKPNGDSVDEKIKTLKADKEVSKILDSAKKLPAKKDDVNLKVVRFDSSMQKAVHEQYIQKDAKILPAVNVDQNNYNRYLPLKINGAQFPIPDAEELRGKKISSIVVLAPVNGDQDESRHERDTIETKKIKFIAGDSLKNLLRKPSTDNFKKWLEKEQKVNPDLQSVVLLVTKDSITGEQEIFMYDIISKTVNRLSGELSSKFVDVAEENIFDESTSISDRIDETISSEEDAEAEPSEIIESIVKPDSIPVSSNEEPENKVLISSGYSVIKNE